MLYTSRFVKLELVKEPQIQVASQYKGCLIGLFLDKTPAIPHISSSDEKDKCYFKELYLFEIFTIYIIFGKRLSK